jgi:murein DD-endopeptidase MepM/ murein hydrolase activator NlpD
MLLVFRGLIFGLAALITLFSSLTTFPSLGDTPFLQLPTPPGQPWQVIQGYGCGTHDDWDFYSLDLAAMHGASAGAPVYAAADGKVMAWVEPSGTLILDHGYGFYTMYTHLASATSTHAGQAISRGAQVGTVGDRGAPGTPHLHFTAYTADGLWGRGTRKSLPLRFVEGYNLPDVGGCNQHVGEKLVSGNRAAAPGFRVYAPQVRAGTGAQAYPATPAPATARKNARWLRSLTAIRPTGPR